ncbi:endonuclease/exonuclease/phosphatase family protein [Oricola sp.]|uniref:endonuclease/exonuclease/phosphatase family protein n=1 Tax=Oricola sp. TaxID=1979950 RepID=UPI003BA90D4E
MRIATFNVQNMRLIHGGKCDRLRGARDRPGNVPASAAERALDTIDRKMTAAVIRDADADIVALQEVFDLETLDYFHDRFLLPAGAGPYPYRVCEPGNDGHGYDVAIISRIPVERARSHATLRPADIGLCAPSGVDPQLPVFRRDCLAVEIVGLSFYVCHFKAPYPEPELAFAIRQTEAAAVRRLIERDFPDPETGRWLIVGDLNEHGRSPPAIRCLLDGFSVDLLERVPEGRRWSFHLEETERYSRPDTILVSPALAAEWSDATPELIREGMGYDSPRYGGDRLPGVGFHRPHASDHAALVVEVTGTS